MKRVLRSITTPFLDGMQVHRRSLIHHHFIKVLIYTLKLRETMSSEVCCLRKQYNMIQRPTGLEPPTIWSADGKSDVLTNTLLPCFHKTQNLTILFRTSFGTLRPWGQWISYADEWLKITENKKTTTQLQILLSFYTNKTHNKVEENKGSELLRPVK